MALANRYALVEYNVGGPRLWHERWVTEHIEGDQYIVVTPDRDVYLEELGLLNDDIRTIRLRPAMGILPAGIVAGEVYPLPAWGANDLAALRDEARRAAEVERRRIAVVPPAPVAGAGPPAAAGAGVVVDSIDEKAGYTSGALKWLFAESSFGCKFGQVALTKGAKAVHVFADGNSVFIECVDGADYFRFLQGPARCDHRVLPLELNTMDMPEVTLKEVAARSHEVPMRWQLTGPRTARWCVNYLAIENFGFEGHHERLRQVTRADASSWGIQEHFQTSMSLRTALLIDQVDPYNLLSIEVQFRRLQTIEFSYSEKAKEVEAKAVGGRLSLEEQTTFGGVTRQYSTLMICPDPRQDRDGEGGQLGEEPPQGTGGEGGCPAGEERWREGRRTPDLRGAWLPRPGESGGTSRAIARKAYPERHLSHATYAEFRNPCWSFFEEMSKEDWTEEAF